MCRTRRYRSYCVFMEIHISIRKYFFDQKLKLRCFLSYLFDIAVILLSLQITNFFRHKNNFIKRRKVLTLGVENCKFFHFTHILVSTKSYFLLIKFSMSIKSVQLSNVTQIFNDSDIFVQIIYFR